MDINRIFNSFTKNEDNIKEDDVNLLVDFSEHPLYWIGYCNKLIINYDIFVGYFETRKAKTNDPQFLEELKEATYQKSWDYIKNINPENPFHMECVKLKSDPTLNNSLNILLEYYLESEEYEKCALLNKIQSIVKENI